jgi:hypothetical protein
MRYLYPKNWILYTDEMKKKWWETEGERQNKIYAKARIDFEKYMKEKVNTKLNQMKEENGE